MKISGDGPKRKVTIYDVSCAPEQWNEIVQVGSVHYTLSHIFLKYRNKSET
jgi:hypothetical protein